jgi:hypothetical protein
MKNFVQNDIRDCMNIVQATDMRRQFSSYFVWPLSVLSYVAVRACDQHAVRVKLAEAISSMGEDGAPLSWRTDRMDLFLAVPELRTESVPDTTIIGTMSSLVDNSAQAIRFYKWRGELSWRKHSIMIFFRNMHPGINKALMNAEKSGRVSNPLKEIATTC